MRPQAVATQMIDDARVRVTRFDFEPDAETGWHRHAMDYVITAITDCQMRLELPERHDQQRYRARRYRLSSRRRGRTQCDQRRGCRDVLCGSGTEMKITRLSVYHVDLPLEHPYWLSGGRLKFDVLDATLVKVETDNGLTGWGEGTPWGSYLCTCPRAGHPRRDSDHGALCIGS